MSTRNKQTDDWKFRGFVFPTTTPVPDQVFDELLYRLSPTEIVVLLYIIRRTFGFKKTSDNISLKQLCEGITTEDGRVLDRGTGLSKATVARVLKSLESKEVIKRTRRRSRKKGDQPTTYELNFLTPVSQIETRGVSQMQQGVSHQRDTQQTVKQQTVSVVVKDLIKRGITEKVAQELASEFTEKHIREKIELLDYLTDTNSTLVNRNPAGYLLKAITEDYSPPKGFKTKAEREAEAAEEEKIRQELEEARLVEQEQEQKRLEQIIAAYHISEDELSIWYRVLDQLKLEVSKATFEKWFKGTYLLSIEDGAVTIGVENLETKRWLTSRGKAAISNLLAGILGEKVTVSFEVIDFDASSG